MNLYRIGELNIGLNSEEFPVKTDDFSHIFRKAESAKPDILFELRLICPEELGHMHDVRRTSEFDLVRIQERIFLVNHWGRCRFGYAVCPDDLKRHDVIPVYVNSALADELPLTANRMLSTIGLHSKLLQKKAPILHASFIVHDGAAILFTAPSGTGKSTQAGLWEKYAGAEIVNGDRVLLREIDNRWYAFGYPCCGSSNICKNKTYPVRAIVVLEQGKANEIRTLPASHKIRALASATEIYPWDMDEVDLAFQYAQRLSETVPVIKLVCRPDEEAVNVLRNYLEVNEDAECV